MIQDDCEREWARCNRTYVGGCCVVVISLEFCDEGSRGSAGVACVGNREAVVKASSRRRDRSFWCERDRSAGSSRGTGIVWSECAGGSGNDADFNVDGAGDLIADGGPLYNKC